MIRITSKLQCCCLYVAITAKTILRIGIYYYYYYYYYYYCGAFLLGERLVRGKIKFIFLIAKQIISTQLMAEMWKSGIYSGHRFTHLQYVLRHSNLGACLRNSTQSFQESLLKTFQHKCTLERFSTSFCRSPFYSSLTFKWSHHVRYSIVSDDRPSEVLH